jgi:hypothetical protein
MNAFPLLLACLAGSWSVSAVQDTALSQKGAIRSAAERQADRAAFVGEYVRSDGFAHERLWVSEDSRCFREARGCRADINTQSGGFFVTNSVLTLQWAPCVQPMPQAPMRYTTVRWGERSYLVAPEQMRRSYSDPYHLGTSFQIPDLAEGRVRVGRDGVMRVPPFSFQKHPCKTRC